jgi:hypothetical protein
MEHRWTASSASYLLASQQQWAGMKQPAPNKGVQQGVQVQHAQEATHHWTSPSRDSLSAAANKVLALLLGQPTGGQRSAGSKLLQSSSHVTPKQPPPKPLMPSRPQSIPARPKHSSESATRVAAGKAVTASPEIAKEQVSDSGSTGLPSIGQVLQRIKALLQPSTSQELKVRGWLG